MKTRERLRRMRMASAFEQVWLAEDSIPGTPFDDLLFDVAEASGPDSKNEKDMARIGQLLLNKVLTLDANYFRGLANALEAWKKHYYERQPDRLRAEVILCTSFGRVTSMRDILPELKRQGIHVDENTPRIVRRICSELGIKLQGTPGRPKK